MSLAVDACYTAVLVAISPVLLPSLAARGRLRDDWRARFGRIEPVDDPRRPRVLLHGVSVGEVGALAPLVAALREQDMGVVLTAGTPTGFARAHREWADRCAVRRFPLDFTAAVDRFLDRTQPDLICLAELELWPNLLAAAERRGIPCGVVSGRLSARSFARSRRFRRWLAPLYRRLEFVGAQDQAYAERFVAMGVPADRVTVTDSLKWDAVRLEEPGEVEGADALAAAMGVDRSRPLIVAGSTGPGEERLLLETLPAEVQLMVVPRKPERFDEVAALDPTMIRRSKHPDGGAPPAPAPPRTRSARFLLDTMGELRKAYALADIAIVGRSLVGLHGSNPIEPVALGKPTIIGPHFGDFQDAVHSLREGGGLAVVEPSGLADAIGGWLGNPAAASAVGAAGRRVILSKQGATRRTLPLLHDALAKRGVLATTVAGV